MAAVNTMKQHGKHLGPFEPTIALGQSQCGFHKCFIHIKYSATSATFHFLHETLRRGKERVSPWWNLWAQFHMRWKLCETPIETQIEFHHATMQLNHTMGEVVGRLSLWKLCNETMHWGRHLFHTKVAHLGNRDGETLHWDWPYILIFL
jgi:hypothetical protein